ncbi:grasp-with-spasm system ATP-grasp peptide maturase [Leptobacterium sp. I13]|uniref:grasp-with-spasm system ATP-grasp peptide maturase n=1 Tax=Leptobacterium meishanense TaxID=3128904 RepID=UPI0030EB45AB
MILILSTPRDYDTQLVIDWLSFNDTPFYRLNDEDIMTGHVSFNMNPKNIQQAYIKDKNNKILFKDIKVVWFRKFGFFKSYEGTLGKNNDITRYIYSEFSIIRNHIVKLLKDKDWLFKRSNMLTKIEILSMASQYGLNIPDSIITSEKKELNRFFEKHHSSIITKSINEGKHIEHLSKTYAFYTHKITSLKNVQGKFSPSLFQEYIEKEYELRIFFLDNKFYPMVIYSQNNEKTKIDFRNYDFENPNRVGCYKLPVHIEKKLLTLMNTIGLNTGSIDMIKSTNGKYYFLEINPSGQFGMTGLPCNYNLHQKVAQYLTNKLNEK